MSEGPAAAAPPQALAAACSLVARLLLLELDAPLLAELGRPPLCETLERLAPGCRGLLERERWSAEALDALAAEYCALLVLPAGVTPYASAWAAGEPAEARAGVEARVRALHTALGVVPAGTGPLRVPADHLGRLLALAAVALERGALAEARAVFALCAPWAGEVAQRIQGRATSPLYRATGGLLAETLRRAAAPPA